VLLQAGQKGADARRPTSRGARPLATLFLSLPLPWRERIEVRGAVPRIFFTLTLALSPQGRGKSWNGSLQVERRGTRATQQMYLFHQPHSWKVMSQHAPSIPTCALLSRTTLRQCSTILSMARSVRSWLIWKRANCLTPASMARFRVSR